MKFVFNDGGRASAGFTGSAGDCVTRAVAIATEQPYLDVYTSLAAGTANERRTGSNTSGHRTARMGIHTGRKWFKAYLRSLGWVWTPTMAIGSGCKVHLTEGELPPGRLIVSISKHYTTVVDGEIHDTHDPQRDGPRCVYGYWRKQPISLAVDSHCEHRADSIALEPFTDVAPFFHKEAGMTRFTRMIVGVGMVFVFAGSAQAQFAGAYALENLQRYTEELRQRKLAAEKVAWERRMIEAELKLKAEAQALAQRAATPVSSNGQTPGTYHLTVKRLDANLYQDLVSKIVIETRLCLELALAAEVVLKWEGRYGYSSWLVFLDSGTKCDVVALH